MKKGSSALYKTGRQERPHRTCYNRNHNYDDTHYIFLQQSDDSDEDERSGRPKHIGLQQLREEYLEKELEPGETLQTLSIQFNCPVAELKRINHIHRDNEVFARRKIKVPVKYYSLLSEKLVGVHKTVSTNREDGSSAKSSVSGSSGMDASLCSAVSNVVLKDNDDASFCDTSLDDHLFSVNSNTLSRDPCDSDRTPLIAEGCEPKESQFINDEVFQCNGSDWGMSWPQLLLCTILLGFAGPIVYIFYLKQAMYEKIGSHLSNNTGT